MHEPIWENIKAVVWNAVWAINIARLPPSGARAVRYLRLFHMLGRELASGQLNLRAASLVYTTLLSLVPVLAVGFALLKAFHLHYEFTPLMMHLLEPLGAKGAELGGRILMFVENVKVAKLGALGVVFLLVTVISLLHKIEQAFNFTWRIEQGRRFFERFSSYLTVVLVGPLLVFAAIGLTATITSHSLFQELTSYGGVSELVALAGKLIPYLLVIAAFTFVYVYIPNTRVRLRSALVGACVAGFLWVCAGWAFATLVVGSTKYTAIYSSFAILVLFMMWIYIGWLILLAGASVAFYHQNPECLGQFERTAWLSNRARERVALVACARIARRYHAGAAPWTEVELARALEVPLMTLSPILESLAQRSLLLQVTGAAPTYVPGRDPATLKLAEILTVVRAMGEAPHAGAEEFARDDAVDALIKELDTVVSGTLGVRSLADLAASAHSGPTPVPLDARQRESRGLVSQ